jgi:hypothetical protein
MSFDTGNVVAKIFQVLADVDASYASGTSLNGYFH